MKALGHDVDRECLVKMMKVTQTNGAFLHTAGNVARELGLDVTYCDQPENVPPKYVSGSVSQRDFRRYVKRSNRKNWKLLIQSDVQVVPRFASLHMIDRMIKRGYVAIVAVRPTILHVSHRNLYTLSHAVIVKRVDFKKRRVYVIDPGIHPNIRDSYSFDRFDASRITEDNALFVR